MKIFELAKELGISSKEVLQLIDELNLAKPTNHFALITDEDAECVRRHFIRRVVSDPLSLEDSVTQTQEPPKPATKPAPVVVRKSRSKPADDSHSSSGRIAEGTIRRAGSIPRELLGVQVTRKN